MYVWFFWRRQHSLPLVNPPVVSGAEADGAPQGGPRRVGWAGWRRGRRPRTSSSAPPLQPQTGADVPLAVPRRATTG